MRDAAVEERIIRVAVNNHRQLAAAQTAIRLGLGANLVLTPTSSRIALANATRNV